MSVVEIPITRATFIADDHVQIAISNLKTIWWSNEDDDTVDHVPMPQSIKDSGVLPKGYCVNFVLDPITLVCNLAKNGIKYESGLDQQLIKKLRGIVNAPDNLAIVPRDVWEKKFQQTIKGLGIIEPLPSTHDKHDYPPKLFD